MSDASEITLADAMVAALSNGEFSKEFEAVRTYEPVTSIEDGELHVLVVPSAITRTGETRAATRREVGIDVGIVQKMETGKASEMDGLMLLAEQIETFWGSLATWGPYRWLRTERTAAWSPEHLSKQGVFFALSTVVFLKLG